MTAAEDIVNRALDCLGVEAIGDLQEGSPAAKTASRQYGPLLRQLLRAAHWSFARRQVSMLLVADATASQPVPSPWLYEYLMPSDCLQVRFVPNQSAPWVQFATFSSTPIWAGFGAGSFGAGTYGAGSVSVTVSPNAMSGTASGANWSIQVGAILTINDGVNTESVKVTATTGTTFTAAFSNSHPNPYTIAGTVPAANNGSAVPLMTGLSSNAGSGGMTPMPYQIASDIVTSEWGLSQFGTAAEFGIGAPTTVVLTNVKAAQLVYTGLTLSPDEWDALFAEAFVAALASRTALSVIEDKKLALALRQEQIGVAKAALAEARVANGNETFTSLNREAQWIRARRVLGSGFRPDSSGSYCNSWDSFAFADGSVF